MGHKVQFPVFIPKSISREIKSIILDYKSGSQELNEKILKLFLKINSKKVLDWTLNFLKTNLTSFEVIQKTINELQSSFENKSLNQIKRVIKKKIQSYDKRVQKIFKKLMPRLFNEIKILTISNSKTVFDLIKLIQRKKFSPEIYVLKSLPGGEGKILYSKLKREKINSHLIEDIRLKNVINLIDIVIIGADKIKAGKWFLNKIGTKKLVTLARKNSKPIYLVALKEKLLAENNQKARGSNGSKLRFDKYLFEKVKISQIDELFIA